MVAPTIVQTNTKSVTLADGHIAKITGVSDPFTPSNTLSFQIFDASGQALGASQTVARSAFQTIVGIDFQAVALTGGGFELLYSVTTSGFADRAQTTEHGIAIGSDGHIGAENFNAIVSSEVTPPPGTSLAGSLLAELDGNRFAVGYQTFDAAGQPTAHVALGSAAGGVYADVKVAIPVDAITHGNGDITLQWNNSGVVIREVLGEDGSVLAARSPSQTLALNTASETVINTFDAAHDQLALFNPDHTVAGGTASTLTFDAHTRFLTWDPDSEGPAAAGAVAVLGGVNSLSVANLQDIFRPEVLKNIAIDGSSTTQWFDSDNSQTWDTLFATRNAAGALTGYSATLDDGTRTVFVFDADNSQPYGRYVDQEDVTGHVLERTTVVDNGESWVAKYSYVAGQVVSYEVDSFDAGGHLVAQGFFNADGSVMAH